MAKFEIGFTGAVIRARVWVGSTEVALYSSGGGVSGKCESNDWPTAISLRMVSVPETDWKLGVHRDGKPVLDKKGRTKRQTALKTWMVSDSGADLICDSEDLSKPCADSAVKTIEAMRDTP